MCPDKKLLSVYFDKELPSPWKEKLESHIESCAECRHTLEVYRRVSGALVPANGELPGMDGAKARVWANLVRRGFAAGLNLPAADNTAQAAGNMVQAAGNMAQAAEGGAKTAAPGKSGFSDVTAGATAFRRQPGTRRPARFTRPREQVSFGVPPFWRRAVHVPLPFALAAAALLVMALFLRAPFTGGAFRAPAMARQALPARSGVTNLTPASASASAAAAEGILPASAEIDQIDSFGFEVPAGENEQVSDMSAILRLLEHDESSNVVIIKLPEKRQYNSIGSPVILRAVDYTQKDGNN